MNDCATPAQPAIKNGETDFYIIFKIKFDTLAGLCICVCCVLDQSTVIKVNLVILIW